MGIVSEDVVRVRGATDIVGLISNTVALRKAGRRWQGLCPFHSEKSPSFSVNAEEGLYYCFGCGASGDAITFVRQTEGLDFVASVELLAARAGITLHYDSKGEAAQHGRRRKLTELVAAAVEWYHERLLQHADAGGARGYLRSRGLTGDEVRKFKVGWAPSDWDSLCTALRSKASAEDLTETGLAVVSSRGGLIDNFRNRVLFPVFDVRGDPVGFGGRILPGADERPGPKYKNTPESPLYTKSRLLYGLNWAKDAMVRDGEVIVCEGYTDVIGLHAAGLPQAVATCGTSLTEDHVKTMRRFCDRIVLAFDADTAGSAAAERIYQWESAHQLDVYVADLPPGADPDDLARRDPQDLRERVSGAQPFLEYRVNRALGRGNMGTAEGRVRAAEATFAVIEEHPSELVRDEYLMAVAAPDKLDLNEDRLRHAVAEWRRKRRLGVELQAPAAEPSSPAAPTIEEQVLLLRVHAGEKLPAWVTARFFASELHGAIFGLLADGAPLAELAEVAQGEAAASLARLSVWEAPDHADDVIGRFAFDAASRWITESSRAARTAGDASLGPRLAEVQLTRSELREQNWSAEVAERLAGLLMEVPPGAEPRAPLPAGPSGGVAGEPPVALSADDEERFYEDLPIPGNDEGFAPDGPVAGDSRR